MSGKYLKQTLERIENDGMMTPAIRKAILDGFNDYARSIETVVTQIVKP